MARQVIVRVLCDPCLENELEVEGDELPPLKLPEFTGRPRVMTLCEVHRKEFYDPFAELLAKLGQPVDDEGNASKPRGPYKKRKKSASSDSSSSSEEEPAPAQEETPAVETAEGIACPTCGHVSPNRAALSAHTRTQHGKTLAELEGKPLPFSCPECGDHFSTAKGQGAHRFRVHGVKGTSKSTKNRAKAGKA